jgi:hypothetical protein
MTTTYKGSLLPETAVTLIERELARFLAVAFQKRLKGPGGAQSTPSIDVLRTFPRKIIFDNALRFVDSVGKTYRFDSYDGRADEGLLVVAPNDSTGLGRWLQEGADQEQRGSPHDGVREAAKRLDKYALQRSGFAEMVRIWEGEYDEEAIAELFSKKPMFVVVPSGSSREAKSLVPGTYYLERFRFRVWSVSQSLRKGPAGLLGLGFGLDGVDPGLNFMVGCVKRALAGSTLGLRGVLSCEIGDEEVVAHDLANRVFVNALEVIVSATLHLPDDDLVPLSQVTTETQLSARSAEPDLDLRNYVATGCHPNRTGPLLATIRGGVAYINGVMVSAIPVRLSMPPSSDVYRDLLPNGSFVVQSVPIASAPPAIPATAMRVGRTQTDAAGITSDVFLCSTMVDFVGPDIIPKE